jgi:hypothetical protein
MKNTKRTREVEKRVNRVINAFLKAKRKGIPTSLSKECHEARTTIRTVLKYKRKLFRKRKGRYYLKIEPETPRKALIYSRGNFYISDFDLDNASKLGSYFNLIKSAQKKQLTSKQFKDVLKQRRITAVYDLQGNRFELEWKLEKIKEIEVEREEEEVGDFEDVYEVG